MNDRCTEGALNPARAEGLRPSAAWKMERTTESRAGGGGCMLKQTQFTFLLSPARAEGHLMRETGSRPE